jgi:hypothetical protein
MIDGLFQKSLWYIGMMTSDVSFVAFSIYFFLIKIYNHYEESINS